MNAWAARAWRMSPEKLAEHVDQLAEIVRPTFSLICMREEIRLDQCAPSQTDVTAALSGSLFGPNGEVKWRRDGEEVWCRLLARTSDVQSAPSSEIEDLAGDMSDAAPMLLWGAWQGDAWLDDRIPRPLRYRLDLPLKVHDELVICCRRFQPGDDSGSLMVWWSVDRTNSEVHL